MSNAGLFTTEGGAIPLRGVEVTGEVLGAHARVRVRQRYQSAEPKPVEAIYTFPLPSDATLIGFAMICGGRRMEGVVKEREQAFKEYDDAVWAGHGAALLEQERPNVFTASVGNLLPGEETLIELEYLERVQADEGALRWMIPTLVAPRYIPGAAAPTIDRTGHGTADPTDRVRDADRITPPLAWNIPYGLTLDVTFELGRDVEVESPSHAVAVQREGARVRVTFAQREVALDRDVVLTARGVEGTQLTTVLAHRPADEPGFLALTVIPDLLAEGRKTPAQDVVFLIDTSGSMEGASIVEARAALKLCLRHLREGDRFNVIQFNSAFEAFQPRPVPFTQRTLEQADAWVEALAANGGTELLEPMRAAIRMAPDGVIVLLTDGQVGNENEILAAALDARKSARVYGFGIGTNVSDALLRDLAKRTTGAVEFIHPGERIDEKVVGVFARAIAARVTGVTLEFRGVDIGELAPSELPPLIDGEPWVIYGRIDRGGHGEAEVRGELDGKPFRIAVPLDLAESTSRPAIAKLWATERIRDLQAAELSGRRADRMRERIIELATKWSVASPYTSFIVVETRAGARRASGQPETRVVPVNVPAGWDLFKREAEDQPMSKSVTRAGTFTGSMPIVSAPSPMPRQAPPAGAQHYGESPPPPSASAHAAPQKKSKGGVLSRAVDALAGAFNGRGGAGAGAPAARPPAAPKSASMRSMALDAGERDDASCEQTESGAPQGEDRVVALLARQLASGLWDDPSAGRDGDARRVRATALALIELERAGVTATHALHGAQVKKAVAALIQLAAQVASADPAAAELALAIAWLVSTGRRTRKEIESAIAAAPPLAGLKSHLADESALRARVDQLARA
ncbi:MAG TPA: VIT domain-containing protein [Polyangia bacterium]|nr:VIT domain-containing protein [Polyangia bacterium]